jgi:putative peptidoglycan lipid II flippase
MIARILSSQSKTITGAALVLGAASFVSRIIGVLRDRIFASQFGAGQTLDVYYAAFRIPDLVYTLVVVGALSAGFIPVFTDLWVREKEKAWRLTNSITTILGVCLLILSVVLYILMPQLIRLITPGFSDLQIADTIALSRIMLLSPCVLGLSGIVSGVLQSLKCFFVYSLTPILYNLGIIFGALFLVPIYGIQGLAYGVVLGAFLHLVVQLPTLRRVGYRPKLRLALADGSVRKVFQMMVPRTLTLATHQLNVLVITALASGLAAGSLTVFTFAHNLQSFPVGIIGIAFAIAAFPTLSEMFAHRDGDAFISHLSQTLRKILFFIIPLTVIFLLLRAQIVRVVLGAGAFDWSATIATADALAFFTLSLFAQAVIPLLIRAFYAMHNTFTPLVIAFISVLINIIGSLVLKNIYGVRGLALAFSIAAIAQLVMLWFALRHTTKSLSESTILHALYKIVPAGIVMAVSIQALKSPISMLVDMTRFWGILVHGAASGLLGLAVYVGLLILLKSEEAISLHKSMGKRWLHIIQGMGHVNEPDDV